jgi:hypothetical protein
MRVKRAALQCVPIGGEFWNFASASTKQVHENNA